MPQLPHRGPARALVALAGALCLAAAPAVALPSACFAAAAPQATAAEAPLVGAWSGSSGRFRGSRLELRGDRTCALDGTEGRWKTYSKDKIRLQLPDGTVRGTFALSGDRLTITIDGSRSRLRREAAGVAAAGPGRSATRGANPEPTRSGSILYGPGGSGAAPSAPAGSPFGDAVAAIPVDSWVGGWTGGGYSLVVRDVAPGLEGTITKGGTSWTFRAFAADGVVGGAVATAAGDVPFALLPADGGARLCAGSVDVRLERSAADAIRAIAQREGAPKLEGVAKGPVERYAAPDGRLSFDVPKPWKVVPASDSELAIDLGFGQGDTVEAMVLVSHGKLTRDELGKKPAQIIAESEADVIEGLAQQGIRARRARRAPTAVQAGRLAGAQQTWKGSLATGDDVNVWIGCVTSNGHHVAVMCLTVGDSTDRYLPGARRILASLEYDAPERNPALERQVAGRRVSQSETTDSGFFGTVYEFHTDGSVMCKTMMSGMIGIGDVGGANEEWGTWMVVGTTLYLEFDDREETAELIQSGGRVTGIRQGGKAHSFE